MDKTEYFRNKIKKYGFLSGTKITIEADKKWGLSAPSIVRLLDEIVNDEIHKIEYTNMWIAPYATKVLFYYNPNSGEDE